MCVIDSIVPLLLELDAIILIIYDVAILGLVCDSLLLTIVNWALNPENDPMIHLFVTTS